MTTGVSLTEVVVRYSAAAYFLGLSIGWVGALLATTAGWVSPRTALIAGPLSLGVAAYVFQRLLEHPRIETLVERAAERGEL